MLLNDARNVRVRLMSAEAAKSGIEEAEALATKRNELKKLVDRVSNLTSRNSILKEKEIPLSTIPGIEKTKQLVIQINARFAESPKVATLVDGRRWSRLGEALTEFSVSAEELQKQDWKTYFNSKLFGGASPEQRKQTILLVLPEHKKTFEIYANLYHRLHQYRNAVPVTVEALNEVLTCSNDLASIRFVENDDVPAPVRMFFNAISIGSGAGLDLLTPEVIDWLRTNGMLDNYVIRAR